MMEKKKTIKIYHEASKALNSPEITREFIINEKG